MKKYLTKIFREILMDLMNEAYQRGKSEGREIGYKEGQESVKYLNEYLEQSETQSLGKAVRECNLLKNENYGS